MLVFLLSFMYNVVGYALFSGAIALVAVSAITGVASKSECGYNDAGFECRSEFFNIKYDWAKFTPNAYEWTFFKRLRLSHYRSPGTVGLKFVWLDKVETPKKKRWLW